jgi:hypothetical protein
MESDTVPVSDPPLEPPKASSCRMAMRTLLAAICLLAAAGCFGHGSRGSSGTVAQVAATAVVLEGPVGAPLLRSRTRAEAVCAARTPAGAHCTVVHPQRDFWVAYLQRRVMCPAPEADAGVCLALGRLIRTLRFDHVDCRCPLEIGPGYRIHGRFRGHPVNIRFDRCWLCGASPDAGHAMTLLFPGA